jgi:hypothetical protein
VPGIEITAAWRGRDVHVLGYFIEPDAAALARFLGEQIQDRLRRARAVGDRLAALGVPIDIEGLISRLNGRPLLRPHIARALADAGHVANGAEAFERFIGEGRPAFVARQGASPIEVVAVVHRAGGLTSMAHPGVTGRDDLIPELADAGLDALEVYYPDHTAEDTARYLALARRLGLAVTGGSDFHGFRSEHSNGFGTVHLPEEDFGEFRRRASR